MDFNSLYEARNWFLNYKEFETPVIGFWYNYDFNSLKFGDYILFQHIKSLNLNNQMVISRPILAIFTSFTIWDQALVLNFIQNKRAWTYSNSCISNPENGYKMLIGHMDDEIENIQFWTDNIHVLHHWKTKPSLSQLRLGLKNQITNRDNKINDILFREIIVQ